MTDQHEPPAASRVRSFTDLLGVVLDAPATLGATRFVCVDGPAGSGKTTLAARLGAAATRLGAEPVTVVHMDDLYDGWEGLEAAVRQRVPTGLLRPLAAGQPGRYRRYDWTAQAYAEWHQVPPAGLLVLEGCGSAARSVDGLAGLRIWIEAPEPLRLRRGLARDGRALQARWLAWQGVESTHFVAEDTRARADVRVAGAPAEPHDPEAEVVVLA